MEKQYLQAGEFVTTHGILGELRLYPLGDGPEVLCNFKMFFLDDKGETRLEVEKIRVHKNICIIKICGINNIEQARPFIGKTLWLSRKEANLPKGRWFVQDVIGAKVVNADTKQNYGIIAKVTRPGRHDVFEIERCGGGVSFFPATEPFLTEINLDDGVAFVRPIEGMLTDEEDVLKEKPAKTIKKKKSEKAGGENAH